MGPAGHSSVRHRTPFGSGSDCDEIVGRFCLRFDSVSSAPEHEEHGRVVDARREAVEAVRRYFSAAPGDLVAAGPLVRLLVRDGRAREAVSGAGAFAALSADTLWGHLLLGYAHHWLGADTAAERHFIAALDRMQPEERREWLDLEWLLDYAEYRRVRRLPAAARTDYERRFWLLADPFWITDANERWTEHIARHVETKLLAEVPLVAGMVHWGSDLDELTIRYGTPTSRARARGSGHPAQAETSMVEYWDSAQRAFDPTELLRSGVPPPARPGERPALYAARARSTYAPRTVARVLELTHQVTRFLRRGAPALRIDAAVPVDSTVRAADVGLFSFDSAFTRRRAARGRARIERDSARFSLIVDAADGMTIYSAELIADTLLAARARYAVDTAVPAGPVLSDLLITRPLPASVRPGRIADPGVEVVASLVFAPGDTLGVTAELYRVAEDTPLHIEVALERTDASLLRRLGQWLGLVDGGQAARVAWSENADGGAHVIALNLPLDPERTGMHELVLRVMDAAGGRTESRRTILIERRR